MLFMLLFSPVMMEGCDGCHACVTCSMEVGSDDEIEWNG